MKNWIHSDINKGDIVVLGKVELLRNIKGKKFVNAIEKQEARQIVSDVYDNLKEYDNNFIISKSWENSQNELKHYKDKEIVTDMFINQRDKSAFIVNDDETLSILVNEEEHIKIQGVSSGCDFDDIYERVNKIDDSIQQHMKFEFSKQYGYLTCDIKNLGTGVRVQCLVHLPALKISEKINDIKNNLRGNKIIFVENYKDSSIYRLSSSITLGVSEEKILKDFKQSVSYIIKEETNEREKLLSERRIELEDRVNRSLGILSYARILSARESINLLSDIRTGIELSILDIDSHLVNKAFIETRDSSIQRSLKEILSKDELDYERAKITRDIFC